MSEEKKPSARRSFQVETVVPGTVEDVWRAIATGPGVSSWFAPCEIDERVDGGIRGDMGMGMQPWGTVTGWDPPYKFVSEGQPMGEDGPTFASEWTIEALSGGRCRVRLVQSLFADSDDWNDELDKMEAGWPGAFELLRTYLEHFAGQPCAIVRLIQPAPGSVADAWSALTGALGLHDGALGAAWQTPEGDAPSLSGTVDVFVSDATPKALVRLERPAPGIASLVALTMGPMTAVSLGLYLYGDDAASVAAREEPPWREWFTNHFPPPESQA